MIPEGLEVVTQRLEYPDSVEIGTPGRQEGCIKVYFNASDLTEAKLRIDNAFDARKHLLRRIAGGPRAPLTEAP